MPVQVCTFATVSCGGFEALTDTGYLQVAVENTGYISADYLLTVAWLKPFCLCDSCAASSCNQP